MKKVKLSRAKKRAWDAFSLYIRTNALKANLIECYTCGNKFPLKKMSAGHAISGRTNALLFLEDVVRPQCIGCNYFGGGKYRIFANRLINEIGIKKYEDAVKYSKKTIKYSVQDCLDIEAKYKKKLADLAK